MATTPWTEEETEKAKALWRAGATAAAIAEQLGRTKNSVIGRMHRLGLGNHPVIDTETGLLRSRGQVRSHRRDVNVTKKKVKKAKEAAAKRAAERRAAAAAVKPKPKPDPNHAKTQKLRRMFGLPRTGVTHAYVPGGEIEMPVPPGFRGVTLIDLEPNQCRYPVGEGRDITFCGQRTYDGCQYCPKCYPVCCYWDGPHARR